MGRSWLAMKATWKGTVKLGNYVFVGEVAMRRRRAKSRQLAIRAENARMRSYAQENAVHWQLARPSFSGNLVFTAWV